MFLQLFQNPMNTFCYRQVAVSLVVRYSPVRIAYLGRSDLLKREVEKTTRVERRALKLNSSSRAYGTLKGSDSYAEISCIAQKENEPKAVSRDTVVLYTKGNESSYAS